MENLNEQVKLRNKADKEAYEKYLKDSKERFKKIALKKIETTMIGALASVEDHFSFLWTSGDFTDEGRQQMEDIYLRVRKEILDKGNLQKKNLEAELENYRIEWLRFRMTLPVKPLPQDGE
jgi:hypothetical protein